MKNVHKPIYPIDFHSITVGERRVFDWGMEASFFEHWPEAEVRGGEGRVCVEVLKRQSMLELAVRIEGRVELTCDRCLEPFWCPVHFEGKPMVRMADVIPPGERYVDNQSDGETLWISPTDQVLDLGQYVYESVMLSLPLQRVHGNRGECNQDMLKLFQVEELDPTL